MTECNLIERILDDLRKFEDNAYIFENLLLALNSFEREP